MRIALLLAVVTAWSTSGHAANAVLAVRGRDPVLLCQGREVPGKEELTATYQGFQYRFANRDHRASFVADPGRYGIQLGGDCAFAADMRGEPDQYVVVEGRIYLVKLAHCMAAFRASPATYVDTATGKRRALSPEERRRKVAVFVFDGVQALDVAGALDVFGQAGMRPFTVAKTKTPITTLSGAKLTPSFDFLASPIPEILVVPGGRVDDRDLETLNWLRNRGDNARKVLTIGRGALYLARARMLDGLLATSAFDSIDELHQLAPTGRISRTARYVDSGTIVTAAGGTAVLDAALHVVEEIDGLGRAQSVALALEYDWRPTSTYARAALADRPIRDMLGDKGFAVPPERLRRWVLTSQDGDNRRWQRRWEAEVDLSADELLATLNMRMAERWTMLRSQVSTIDATSDWRWVDGDGIAWNGAARVHKIDPVASRFEITLRVERE